MTDPWWNPAIGRWKFVLILHCLMIAIEDQAFDRAHRLGQTRDVNIYKLMIPNTVEERILEVCGCYDFFRLIIAITLYSASREKEGTR